MLVDPGEGYQESQKCWNPIHVLIPLDLRIQDQILHGKRTRGGADRSYGRPQLLNQGEKTQMARFFSTWYMFKQKQICLH